jgi:hypothetical protein
MTNQEWKRRCVERIYRAVKKAGRIRIRDLKRATHYNRGPGGPEGYSLDGWYGALEELERSRKIDVERDDDVEVAALYPGAKETMRVTDKGITWKYRR